MSNNFIQPGDTLEFIAPGGGVVGGVPEIIGGILVIPAHDAVAAAVFQGHLVGVWDLSKDNADTLTVGQICYWDVGNSRFTTVSAPGLLQVGVGASVEIAAATTGKLRLDGIGRLVV
jgi:predicted RecA/RadA family phage recombinase